MAGFDHHPHAARVQGLHEGAGDLGGEALLDLQPVREAVDEARDAGEANDGFVGEVGDVGMAEERQQMVLAQRVQLDALHGDHLVRFGRKDRIGQLRGGIAPVAGREELERLRGAQRGALQAISGRVVTACRKQLAVRSLQVLPHGAELYELAVQGGNLAEISTGAAPVQESRGVRGPCAAATSR